MTFDVSLSASQQEFVTEQARAQKVSPKTYVKRLIDREREAETQTRRALLARYLELVEAQMERSGGIPFERESFMRDMLKRHLGRRK